MDLLLDLSGGVFCLFEIGFLLEEDDVLDERTLLPDSESLGTSSIS